MAKSGGLTPYLATIAAVAAGQPVTTDALDAMQAALRSPLDKSAGGEDSARRRAAEDILRALVELDAKEAAFANSLGLILQDRHEFAEAAGLFLQAAARTEGEPQNLPRRIRVGSPPGVETQASACRKLAFHSALRLSLNPSGISNTPTRHERREELRWTGCRVRSQGTIRPVLHSDCSGYIAGCSPALPRSRLTADVFR